VSVKLPGSAGFYTLASYTYDEQGYRIAERTYPDPMYPFAYKQTYYIRDGSGNILATYFIDSSSGQVQLRKQIVYYGLDTRFRPVQSRYGGFYLRRGAGCVPLPGGQDITLSQIRHHGRWHLVQNLLGHLPRLPAVRTEAHVRARGQA
jgi:hypothetical protein